MLIGSIGVSESGDFQRGVIAYQNGDYVTALREFTSLAEKGNADAQVNLGIIYQKGRGVPQDYKTAVKWYRLAAKQGNASAQASLGAMYAFGMGVVKNDVYAHMWGSLAASNGNKKGAKLRDFVAKRMTPSQLDQAQDFARRCVGRNYKDC